ncbi:MAG: sulfotransferase domain-containing protein [Fuerstiella sp.]|nr:hypothetical protein [Fuerstiella sp.]
MVSGLISTHDGLLGTKNSDDFSSEHLLPNLIIPGVQKCATTSMHAILRRHPQCRMSAEKELNFFTARWNEWNLPEYGRRCFPDDGRGDLRVFGESSTTYFSTPEAAVRIREFLGAGVRILILLRNPVDRAISAYWHMVKRSAEHRSVEDVFANLSSEISDAIAGESLDLTRAKQAGEIDCRESAACTGDEFWNFRYVRNSCYLEDLQRFQAIFGREQVYVVLLEDLTSRYDATLRRVAEFLQIDADGFGDFPVTNVTTIPKHSWGMQLANTVARRLPGGPLRSLRNMLLSATTCSPSAIPLDMRRRMSALFHDHNEQLAGHLRRDLSIWNV